MVLVVYVDFKESANPTLARVKYKIPQFFDVSGVPYDVENLYLCTNALRLSEKSVRTAAEHIKELLLWRIGIGRDLVDFTDDDLDYFIDAQCSYRKSSGNELAWNTVNSRVSGSHRFLVWCRRKGYNENITLEASNKAGAGARVTYKIKGHPSREHKEPTKFLSMDSAIEFIHAVGEVSAGSESLISRNRLIARLMLQSGLRISEAVGFPIVDLPEINRRGHSTPARIIGKGEKPRVILIPNCLLSDLWAYADLARKNILDDLQEAGFDSLNVKLLFISGQGRGVTRNWIEKIFAKAGSSVGIKAVPHTLRHTFGTYHYLLNKDLLKLAKLMGHESEVTTEKFYVHMAKLISHSGTYEEFQCEVDQICAGIS